MHTSFMVGEISAFEAHAPPVLGLTALSLAAACVLSALLGCAAVGPEHPRVIIAAAAAEGACGESKASV